MFGDYFQHDAHELLRCVLTHIDDSVSDLRQFCSSALSTTTHVQLTSLASHQTLSHCVSQPADVSYDTVISPVASSPSSSLLTRTVESCSPLSSSLNGKPQATERSPRQRRSVQSWSPLSSQVNGKPHGMERTSRWTRSVQSRSPLSSSVNGKTEAAERSQKRSMQSWSPLSSQVNGKPHGMERTSRRTRSVQSRSPLSSSVNGKTEAAERSPSLKRSVQSLSSLSSQVNGKPHGMERTPRWTRSMRSCSPLLSCVNGKPEAAERSPSLKRSMQSWSSLSSQVNGKPQGMERTPCRTRSVQSYSPLSSSVYGKPQVERSPYWTRSVKSWSPLSSIVNGKAEAGERTPRQSGSCYWHSPLSSPCRHIVVDLCMPRKCQSLSALPQQSSATVVVSPDLLCDRLKRKRKSPWSSLIYYQQVPMKCKNIGFLDCCTSVVDDMGKNCEPAVSDCLQDGSLAPGGDTYKLLVNELLNCDSQDCCTEQLANDAQSTCDMFHSVTDGPVSDGQCSLEAFPQASGCSSLSAKDQLLLSLHAIESGRSCYISLCRRDTSGLSPEAVSFRDCTSKAKKTSINNISLRRHVSRVQDMFGGEMLTETKCLNCFSVTQHSESYEDVALFAGHSLHSRTCHTSLCCASNFIYYHV